MDKYYIQLGEEPSGPYTFKQLKSMWLHGNLTVENLYMTEGSGEWSRLADLLVQLEEEKKELPFQMPTNMHSVVSGEVRVSDVKMKFTSMVIFMLKWAIAAIPALIILAVLFGLLSLLLSGVVSKLLEHH
jgi:hypothetical protein